MMRQYQQLKARFPGTLLMFRLGDFYELFFDDAVAAARELEITLTSREIGKGRRVPMCGVPHHAVEGYLARLVERGYRIALCDQLEDPRRARGLVKRDVVRVVTPGTVIEQSLLPRHANNFLVAVSQGREAWGLAAADLSTGEFQVTELSGTGRDARLAEEIARFNPREILVPEPAERILRGLAGSAVHVTVQPAWIFDETTGRQRLHRHFGVVSLDGFGCAHLPAAVAAAGALLQYLQDTQFSPLAHIRRLTTYAADDGLVLDAATRRNLEIVGNQRDGGVQGTLLEILDETKTGMGARRLRSWLLQPLTSREAILRRLDAVEEFVRDAGLRAALRSALSGVADLERLVGRVGHGSATPRDLRALAASLRRLPLLAEGLARTAAAALRETAGQIHGHDDVAALIERAIVEAPPAGVQEGGIIRDGYSTELDALRTAAREGKDWIARLEAEERARTGIKSLKVGFNKVFGYYIEVSKPNLSLVPADYIRKQTLANAERFVTEAMKEREAAILGAEERMRDLEHALFVQVRDQVALRADELLRTARAVADLDAWLSLAEVAAAWSYVRPEIAEEPVLEITAGRHPVVERTLMEERFVPNDARLSTHDRAILIVTGPNMAGKSTYLRQVALIVLLAQVGSFVPAAAARIGLVDRIFTRVGAVDDIATGRSTFLVEMQEVGYILHHATGRSLVILDEVGRGTSTYDGMSIAWAVVEHLHDQIGCRTLFATHYHELTELAQVLPRVHNVNVLVKEEGERVIFLRRVVDGGADRSYGIHVAQLAGLPAPVIAHAQRILRQLEAAGQTIREPGATFLPPLPSRASGALQLPLPLHQPSPVEEALMALSLEAMTPLEALQVLHALREQARQRLAAAHTAPHPGKVVRMKRHGPKTP
ncbi:MAG: DNA mismatch repair protein MutS [Armatimonadota bacterium]|nr:DNA mismatch repair protein MutS [Armatimonadota bacterium]MDR7450267.1 DNA mismatch repair protein MutS [Armatimonadota bacterium]MDR7467150.1 DNA mismatch repair protein MutS [Armatimonadota bacterium]MDR7493308.1 DNA mismatch repair protein MutS [Armatimonadota bacterium]MDR7500157.1 DNA mismatch repair protein MutS [Armatimonadota bacterium]